MWPKVRGNKIDFIFFLFYFCDVNPNGSQNMYTLPDVKQIPYVDSHNPARVIDRGRGWVGAWRSCGGEREGSSQFVR
jgi:hypothetical protein